MAHSHSNPANPETPVAGKDMNLKRIMLVWVVSLSVFALGIIWAYYLMVARVNEIHARGVRTAPTEIGKAEIGIVDQVLFSTDHRLDDWKAMHRKRLETFGWSDKAKGLAHIPIEQAMQKVIASPPDIPEEGVAPAAAPAGLPAEHTEQASGVNKKVGTRIDDRADRETGGKK
jgi:hypothetical protein